MNLIAERDDGRNAQSSARRPLVVFSVAGQRYAIPLQTVQEIVPMAELSRPPGLRKILAGFLNLGGVAVAVLRLDHLFEVGDQAPGLHTPLLILRGTEFPTALMVDKVLGIVPVADEEIMPVRETYSFNECAEGVVTVDDAVVILLSPDRILLEKEQQCLAELEAMEHARLQNMEEKTP